MRVAFAQLDYLPSLGVGILSNLLRQKGYQPCTLFARDRNFPFLFETFAPDLLALSLTSGQVRSALNLVAWAKKKNPRLRVVVGGPHPTFVPEIIHQPGIDFVVRGEGESALPALCRALQKNAHSFEGVPNLVWQNGGDGPRFEKLAAPVADLDSLPHPDWRPYFAKAKLARFYRRGYTIISGRGCPFSCAYCHNEQLRRLYNGRKLTRRRSVEAVLSEIEEAKAKFGVRQVRFDDETFFLDKQYLAEFAEANVRRGLPFSCNVVASSMTEPTARLLAEAGCFLACIGLETGDSDLRRRVLNKHVSDEQITRAVRLLRRHGIRVETFNMMGLPGERLNQALQTYDFNRRLKPDFAWCSIFQPYPGTAFYGRQRETNPAAENEVAYPISYFDGTVLTGPELPQIIALQALLQLCLFLHLPTKLVRQFVRPGENALFRALFFASFFVYQVFSKKLSFLNSIPFGWSNRSRVWRRRDPDCNWERFKIQCHRSWNKLFHLPRHPQPLGKA